MRKFMLIVLPMLGMIGVTVVVAGFAPQVRPEADRAAALVAEETLVPFDTGGMAVRLLLGSGDTIPVDWSGSVRVEGGTLQGIDPWRLAPDARVTGPDSWTAGSLVTNRDVPKTQPKKAAARKAAIGRVEPASVIVRFQAPASGRLIVTTPRGEASFAVADLASGSVARALNGQVLAQRVPVAAPVVLAPTQDDFPSATSDGDKGVWVAYIAHTARGAENSSQVTEVPPSFKAYIPTGGGDQIFLVHHDGSMPAEPIAVTTDGLDLWRPAVVKGPEGQIHVVWPQNVEGNWDLYGRVYDPSDGSWGETLRLTTDPGGDSDPVLAFVGDRVMVAWQAWREGQADIHLASLNEMERPINLSTSVANEWSPSIAAGPAGSIGVAYDTYQNGNYDVHLARVAGGKVSLTPVAQSSFFEVRPSLAFDSQGRPWLAYEERAANWGKDFGKHDDSGSALYRESRVQVRCVEGDKVLDCGIEQSGNPNELNSYPRLGIDHTGRPFLLLRRRLENNWRGGTLPGVGAIWLEYVTYRVGDGWSAQQVIPRSENLLDNRPSLVATPQGPLLAVYATDGRFHQAPLAARARGGRGAGRFAADRFWVNNDIFIAALTAPAGTADATPGKPVAATDAVTPVHTAEADDIARMRDYRGESGDTSYQLLRGEFHRHTEISSDGGGDGSLEDMWRYGIDVAGLDWIGCGDHDNGNGREYTWWMTQKTTDLYHSAGQFMPMFTYERSVNYPGGHRNVMFEYRGVRTLPRLTGEGGMQIDIKGRDLDVQMLYKYLNELNGICAVHTSGTDMGTDWRENDPRAEPFVEIYQGDRDNYEALGAPRAAHSPADSAGGWRPLGMVWNALALQYKMGFQSSSDHISTHISFAIALAEEPTRKGIFEAFQKRHCYAATDNILLDVRCGPHMMGDAFASSEPVTLHVLAHGTGPIKRVDIIRDFHYVYSTEPGSPRVEFSWTDESPRTLPESWYYVRLIQEDGEIAWGSPMWVSKP